MTRKEQLVLLAFAGAIVLGAVALLFHQPRQVAPKPALAAVRAPAPVEQPVLPPQPVASLQAPEQTPPPVAREPEPQAPPPPAEPAKPEPQITVAAAGEVTQPGAYVLPQDARVRDLLDTAGGPTGRGDLSDINLAAKLIDGTTLTIPARREVAANDGALRLHGGQRAARVNPPQYTVSGWQPTPVSADPAPADKPAAADPPAAITASQPADGPIDLNSATQDALETLPGIGPKLAAEIIAYRTQNRFLSVDDLTNVSGIGPKKLEGVRSLVTVR